MMIDQNKRKTIKALGVAGIATTTAAAMPNAFAAVQKLGDKKNGVEQMPFSGITVKHYDNFQGHTVLLRNETDRPVTLYEVSPGYITTPSGEFNLNALLESGDLTIPANATQAVSISHDGNVSKYASWVHFDRGNVVAQTGINTQSVNVVGQYDSLHGSVKNSVSIY